VLAIKRAGEAAVPGYSRRREPGKQTRHALGIALEGRKGGTQELLLAVDGRSINEEEEQRERQRDL